MHTELHRFRARIWSLLSLVLIVALAASWQNAKAATNQYTVTPVSADWVLVNDNNTTGDWAAGFQNGPVVSPLGNGSLFIQLNSALAGIFYGSPKYQGTKLADIATLSYSTYSNNNTTAIAFQINYDLDMTVGGARPWFGRLIYEPYTSGSVVANTWQTWDMLAGKWWASNNGNSTVDDAGNCPQNSPCTWSQLLTKFPNIGIRNDSNSMILFKAGSNWSGFRGNVDNFVIEISGGNKDVYDFEFQPSIAYVDDDWAGTTPGTDPDGAGPATSFGYDAFATIQGGIDGVLSGGTVHVLAGTYNEDVNINKPLTLSGANSATTIVQGPIGGNASTFRVTANNVVLQGFTITRVGNNIGDWNNAGLNSAGISIQGAYTNAVIQNNLIVGNRTGIDINNSSGHTIQNNQINDNRTGLLFRNKTDNMTVLDNEIKGNWTVGILFLDASSGTNSPEQSAHNSTFSGNDLSGNWYGQVVERQTGGSLPAPATTNTKNFVGNWWGTTAPVVSTADSGEPGYAALIPVAYGGSATPPGGKPDILGPASANIIYQPLCFNPTCAPDVTAPTVSSIVRVNTNPTAAASVNFTVTFSEDVTGVDALDFALMTTGGISGASVTSVSGSGSTYTVSVNTGAGDGTIRLDVSATATISDLANNAMTSLPFTSGEIYTIDRSLGTPFYSVASQDGWILETNETSNKGGSLNSGAKFLNIGDDEANRQYRAVLSFDTSTLPDNAVVSSVLLRIKPKGVVGGGNPINILKGFKVDMATNGVFGAPGLELSDFYATGVTLNDIFKPALTGGWYSLDLSAGASQINLTGATQIRLRFKLDDNNNHIANILQIFSGNAALAKRPQLIVNYSVP
ncbi:MAG: right-handed parallel beta-helix repeat-containing protein [Anaerolineales bacterium]|nr:right-handed parallel beta-helix repeat-containing protein [Anaerolineales bacterium]